MIREIKIYPDKILSKKAKRVGQIDDATRRLIEDMVETLYSQGGAGLAANQIGELKQVAVIAEGDGLRVLINPKIIGHQGRVVATEGCLSLPGYEFTVKRPQKIFVEYLDKSGREQKLKTQDLLARVICHEVDHLEGKTILDRLPIVKRLILKRKIKKSARKK